MDIIGKARSAGGVDLGAYQSDLMSPAIVFVDISASGTDDGSDWSNAYTSIKTAVDSAGPGSEIWVAQGIYFATSTNTASDELAPAANVAIYGGFSGNGLETQLAERDWVNYPTIVDGDFLSTNSDNTDNSKRLFTLQEGNRLDGLIIQRAYEDTSTSGAGIKANSIGIDGVYNCVIRDNFADYHGAGALFSNTTGNLHNVVFANNETQNFDGAGLSVWNGNMQIVNAVFYNNKAGRNGGGAHLDSGTGTIVYNSVFFENHSNGDGGGLSYTTNNIRVKNSIIRKNTSNATHQNVRITSGSNSTFYLSNIQGDADQFFNGSGVFDSIEIFKDEFDPDGADDIWMTEDDGLIVALGSPSIDIGVVSSGVNIDILGKPHSGNPDLGAYETDGMASINPPVYAKISSLGVQAVSPTSVLRFRSSFDRAIQITGEGDSHMVNLFATSANLVLSTISNLSGLIGNGSDNISFTANVQDANRAMDGLALVPHDGYHGFMELHVSTDDGSTFDGNVIPVIVAPYTFALEQTVEIDGATPNGPSLGNTFNYGIGVTSIGDFDGDHVNDIAVGANWDSDNGSQRGSVFIHLLNSDGSVKQTYEIDDTAANGPSLLNDDNFGSEVESLGDLDGDGVIDLAVGSNNDDNGGTDRGAVHILFMNSDGSVKQTVEINSSTVNGPTLNDGDVYSTAIANIGDLDGDGVIDLAVGAKSYDGAGTDRGAVFIHFMNADGSVKFTSVIDDSTANGPSLLDGDFYGFEVRGIGDLNNDGVEEVAVGATFTDDGATDQGSVFIHFMNTNGTVQSTVELNALAPNMPLLQFQDNFGRSIAGLGDLDGDGVEDMAVGSYLGDNGTSNRGLIYILYMNSDGSVKDHIYMDGDTQNGPIVNNVERFGQAITSIGDLDEDGVPDLAVGAYKDDGLGSNQGSVHILFSASVQDVALVNTGFVAPAEIYEGETDVQVMELKIENLGTENVSFDKLNLYFPMGNASQDLSMLTFYDAGSLIDSTTNLTDEDVVLSFSPYSLPAMSNVTFSLNVDVQANVMTPAVALELEGPFYLNNGNVMESHYVPDGNIALATSRAPTILYVNAVASGNNDGFDWGNAFNDLKDALDIAIEGDEIWVAMGNYQTTSGSNRFEVFSIPAGNIGLYGGFSGNGLESSIEERDPFYFQTILNGDIGVPGVDTDNAHHVMDIKNGARDVVVDGFYFCNGYNNSGVSFIQHGALMVIENGGVTIENCVFENGHAAASSGTGGAINLQTQNSFAKIKNCVFKDNSSDGKGGALFVGGVVEMENAVFVGNYSGSAKEGGAINVSNDGQLQLYHSIFVDNHAGSDGGAIFSTNVALIKNSIFWNNTALGSGPSIYNSGAISIGNSLVEGSGGSASWVSMTGTDLGDNIDVDPNFSAIDSPAGGDGMWFTGDEGFILLEPSPAMNSGEYLSSANVDVLGLVRDTSPHMGLFETTVYVVPTSPILTNTNFVAPSSLNTSSTNIAIMEIQIDTIKNGSADIIREMVFEVVSGSPVNDFNDFEIYDVFNGTPIATMTNLISGNVAFESLSFGISSSMNAFLSLRASASDNFIGDNIQFEIHPHNIILDSGNMIGNTQVSSLVALDMSVGNVHLLSTSPYNGETDVSSFSNLVLEFDLDVVYAAGNGLLEIRDYDTQSVVQTLTSSNMFLSGNNLVVYPEALAEGEIYYIEITPDLIEGVGGESFAGISDNTSWVFTTAMNQSEMTGSANIESFAAGAHHALYVKGGVLYAMGHDAFGATGLNTGVYYEEPQALTGTLSANRVAVGDIHSLVLDTAGNMLGMGTSTYLQLPSSSTLPSLLDNDIVEVEAGPLGTYTLNNMSQLYSMGRNQLGQLGSGSSNLADGPSLVLTGVQKFSIGVEHGLAIVAGNLYAWGSNGYGQLGDPSIVSDSHVPVLIDDSHTWVEVEAGGFHSFAVTSAGEVFAWGKNDLGQLGDPGLALSGLNQPTMISSLTNQVLQVEAGLNHTLIQKSDGSVWAAGSNEMNQAPAGSELGLVAIPEFDGADYLVAGPFSSFAVFGAEVEFMGRRFDGTMSGPSPEGLIAVQKAILFRTDFSTAVASVIDIDTLTLDGGDVSLAGTDFVFAQDGEAFYGLGRYNIDTLEKRHFDDPMTSIYNYSLLGNATGTSNPIDIIVGENGEALITRYDSSEQYLVDLHAQSSANLVLQTFDISAYVDVDGQTEAAAGTYLSGNYFIALQGTDRNNNYASVNAHMVRIENDGNQTLVPLPAKNPGDVVYSADHDLIFIACPAQYGGFGLDRIFEGGIVTLDPHSLATNLLVDDDAGNLTTGNTTGGGFYNGLISQVAIADFDTGYFVTYSSFGDNSLKSFDPSTGVVDAGFVSGLNGLAINDIKTGPDGNLWVVLDGEVKVIDPSTNSEIHSIPITGLSAKGVFFSK